MSEIKNAIIESARFDTGRGLSAWLTLNYGGTSQGFGGYLLYAPKGWKAHKESGNFCGHFIWRCLEIVGVNDWAELPGKPIRVKADYGKVHAIGHIIDDKWFDPSAEFEAFSKGATNDQA